MRYLSMVPVIGIPIGWMCIMKRKFWASNHPMFFITAMVQAIGVTFTMFTYPIWKVIF